jgi:hypothetical protein
MLEVWMDKGVQSKLKVWALGVKAVLQKVC